MKEKNKKFNSIIDYLILISFLLIMFYNTTQENFKIAIITSLIFISYFILARTTNKNIFFIF